MKNSIKVTAIAAAMSLFSSATIAQVVDFDGPIPAGVTVEYFRNTGDVLAALPTTLADSLLFASFEHATFRSLIILTKLSS